MKILKKNIKNKADVISQHTDKQQEKKGKLRGWDICHSEKYKG